MVYTNERWNYQLELADNWRLKSEGGGQPEFDGGSAALKIATGPVPIGRRPQDELLILRRAAAKYGHRVISDDVITVDGSDHATVTCEVPNLGILKTYGLIFLDREFLITGAGDLNACDAAVGTFRLMNTGFDIIDQLIQRADAGDADAQFTLGLHYHNNGNHPDAFRRVLQAAEGGHPIAQLNAGICYANGEGTEIDLVEALKWLLLSVKSGCRLAPPALADIRAHLSPAQIVEATRRAEGWQTRSWSLDDARRYLKRTGDLDRSGCAGQALGLVLVAAGCAVCTLFR